MRRFCCSAVLVLLASSAAVLAQSPAAGATGTPVEELYRQNCQMCHMPDGNAAIKEMNFADGEWKHGTEVKDLVKVIAEGVPATAMMSFKGRLTDEQIEALAKHVRTFDKKLKPADGPDDNKAGKPGHH